MNRNFFKIIAVISMLIDHIGAVLCPSLTFLRWIGRLAFPIFAFFIAEGWNKTKDRKKYVLMLFLFSIISQVPYGFAFGWNRLNTLFTFLIAIFIIWLIENYNKREVLNLILLIFTFSLLIIIEFFGVVDYGVFGVLLIVVFYIFKNLKLKVLLGIVCMILLTGKYFILSGYALSGLIQLFSIISLLLLLAYNGNKGRLNLKWMFYVFYPAHLIILNIIKLFM